MNKKTWIILLIIVLLVIGGGIFLYFKNSSPPSNDENYEADKTSVNTTLNQTENDKKEENTSSAETQQNTTETEKSPTPRKEEQISTFSTKIYSKDSARQNNISITCRALNGTIVENGATFSFCNTVGPSSTSKGYQKADIFDKNGNKKKGLGGRKLSN